MKFTKYFDPFKQIIKIQSYCSVYKRSVSVSATLQDNFNVQDDADFKEKVLNSKIPVIVDFHAKWCGPCKLLGPRLDAIEDAKRGKISLAKVDIDENDDLAATYQVSAVPFVLGIKNGKVVDKFIGLLEDDKLNAFVDKLVGPDV